jgi:hypothetical protein
MSCVTQINFCLVFPWILSHRTLITENGLYQKDLLKII